MTFEARWRERLPASLEEFADQYARKPGDDLVLFIATALLWPVRRALLNGEEEALTALRRVAGIPADQWILDAMQGWDLEEPTRAVHSLAVEAEKNKELRPSLVALNAYFDAIPAFAEKLARRLAERQNAGDVYEVTGMIQAALVNIGGALNIDDLMINIDSSLTETQLTLAEKSERWKQLQVLETIKRAWLTNRLDLFPHQPAWNDIHKRVRPDLVHNPWDEIVQIEDLPVESVAISRSIEEVFADEGHALLIASAPGTFNTRTLLELAQACAVRAEKHPLAPIPVVLQMAAWSKRPATFLAWLVEQLNSLYRVPPATAESWIQNDELMFLLDGLNEVPSANMKDCILAINQFRNEHSMTWIAISTRLSEYTAQDLRLALAGAIELLR